jgi:hypothetical protein
MAHTRARRHLRATARRSRTRSRGKNARTGRARPRPPDQSCISVPVVCGARLTRWWTCAPRWNCGYCRPSSWVSCDGCAVRAGKDPEKDPSSVSAGMLLTQTVTTSAKPSSTGSPTECASTATLYRKPASSIVWSVGAERPRGGVEAGGARGLVELGRSEVKQLPESQPS